VRRLLAWTAGVVGIAALGRALARNRRHHPPTAAQPPVDERADALRRKLSETRAAEPAPVPPEAPLPTPAAPEAAVAAATSAQTSETIEERRARVHAKAQEVIDAMQETLE
jgi:hypothetical protein